MNYKNLKEILELSKDELDNWDIEIHATLERKELIELRALMEENEHLRDLYLRTAKKLKENGKEELADYFLAQIGAVPTLSPQ